MRKSNDIAEAYVSSNLTRYAMEENKVASSQNTIRALEDEKELDHFYSTITEGTFPQSDHELLVNPLCFPDIKVGDTITLHYEQAKVGYSETGKMEFSVCGLYVRTHFDTKKMLSPGKFRWKRAKNKGFRGQNTTAEAFLTLFNRISNV